MASRSRLFGTTGDLFRVVVMLLALLAQGCAAIPIAAVGGLALQAGGGVLVKTGTEYTRSGAAYRTFSIALEHVHIAALEAFRRTDVALERIETSSKGQTLVARAEHRKIRVRLIPLTRALTSMELVVKRNILASDRATASELLAQTERVLLERRLLLEADAGPSTPVKTALR